MLLPAMSITRVQTHVLHPVTAPLKFTQNSALEPAPMLFHVIATVSIGLPAAT